MWNSTSCIALMIVKPLLICAQFQSDNAVPNAGYIQNDSLTVGLKAFS